MIAFWSTRTGRDNPTGDQEIFVMNANGSGLRQVTYNTFDDGGPSWSPDGDRLVFHRFIGDGTEVDLMTVRVNGTGERNLTRSPGIGDRYGVWSPDGRGSCSCATTAGSRTTSPRSARTAPTAGTDRHAQRRGGPHWSPTGSGSPSTGDAPRTPRHVVYVMRRDGGSPPTRLTTPGASHPAWSPDGRKILFSNISLRELFTMRADGSRLPRTVRPGFDAHHPDWQPVPKDARAEDDDD